ncbi:MAG: leucyl-tRNA synthetase, partial [Patescibacteria group bacterium]|nr:leucyl-tRNA synthetase [Patescibacteria group bacterium]
IKNSQEKIKVFTTRADTLFGVTYVVLAPEHELVNNLKSQISNWVEVEKYVKDVKKKTDIERTDEGKEKTGVELKGIVAINPSNNEEVPVYVADYVLPHYGTGAVMAVPMHDERDRDFSNKFNLPIIDRPLVDINEITEKVGGKIVTKFKLRDWVFSRQRYWGEPIPIVNCEKCGYVPLSEKDLPLELPKVKSYAPTDNGESPLANITAWVNTKCPKCKGKAKRETDTMPNWAGSSWYFLRYTDPKNKKEFANKNVLKYWMKNGIDWYNGGMEHTTLHLLYSRFWHKFLYDLKVVPTSEPYMKRTSHGMILAEGGEKMSKSVGNTVNPDEIVKLYGADTLRMYEMFMGPFDQAVSWSTESMIGPRRFLERVWRLGVKVVSPTQQNFRALPLGGTMNELLHSLSGSRGEIADVSLRTGDKGRHDSDFALSPNLDTTLHKTIKKVTEDIESMNFNTAVSSMMVLLNEMEKCESVSVKDYKIFLQILAPFAPHIAEDLWMQMGDPANGASKKSIHLSKWPKFDPKKLESETIKIGVQVNGKVRAELIVGKDDSEEDVTAKALADENVIKWIDGKPTKKIIYVKGRLVNIVI